MGQGRILVVNAIKMNNYNAKGYYKMDTEYIHVVLLSNSESISDISQICQEVFRCAQINIM